MSVKLRHLSGWTDRRIAIADRYLANLAGVEGLTLPVRANWAKQVYHLFVVRTDRRDELKEHLAAAGVETGVPLSGGAAQAQRL